MLSRTVRPFALAAVGPSPSSEGPWGPNRRRGGVGKADARRTALPPEALPHLSAGPTGPGSSSGARSAPPSDADCSGNAACICPRPDHVTDAERAVMDAFSRQVSRWTRVLALVFAVAAVVSLVLLILR